MNPAELKVGGMVALVGGCVGFVVNLMHPTPPAQPHDLLKLVAATPHWPQLHFMGMLAILLILSSMAMLSRNLVGEMARAIGVLGRYIFIAGGTVVMVMTMVDGFASKKVADALFAADPAQQQLLAPAANSIIYIERALFPIFAGVFLGLAFMVMGAAVWRSENFPRWLGIWAMLGGLMCAVVGFGVAFRLDVPLPLWLVGVVAVVTWVLAMGVAMLRASARPAV